MGCKWIACGVIAGAVLGAVGAMALTGELNQQGVDKIAQNIGKTANKMGI